MDDITKHQKRVEEVIGRTAAEFFARHLPSRALVTVTNVSLAQHGREAIIFITVLPEQAIDEVLRDARRLRTDLRDYLREATKIGNVPQVDIVLGKPDFVLEDNKEEKKDN